MGFLTLKVSGSRYCIHIGDEVLRCLPACSLGIVPLRISRSHDVSFDSDSPVI
jgi:hypothetical protein